MTYSPAALPLWNPDLPLEERLDDLLTRLTLTEKIGLMPTQQHAVPRLGIPEYWVGGEAAHGLVIRGAPTTIFPQTIGLACSWSAELLQLVGGVIGDEARAYFQKRGGLSGLTVWAPTVDMERDPRWGRTDEAYGEDPHLTGMLSTALIRGMQGDDPFYIKVAPALKHFYGNNNERDRLKSSSSIDPRNRREYYLKAFEKAVIEGQVHSIMTAYNEINGTPAIAHPDIQKVLKGEWNLDGFVVCDGADMHMTVTEHGYCQSYAEAVALAIKSGIDCVTDDPELVKSAVHQALAGDLLTEADLDRALRNVFRIRFRLGQFDPAERNPYAHIPVTAMHRPEHRALALRAARESIVLLKNDGLLPLDPGRLRQATVIGPLADVVYRGWYTGQHPYIVTPLQGIVERLAPKTVLYEEGNDHISLQDAATGLFVTNKGWDDGTLVATRSYSSGGEIYLRTDWGWGVQTLKSLNNGLYVTADEQTARITAAAQDIWGWFVKEQFRSELFSDSTAALQTWNGHSIVVAGEDSALTIAGDDVTPSRFRVHVVRDGTAEAVRSAQAADVALIFAGNHPLINGKEEIDRPGLTLPPQQEHLIREVHRANPNTVLVIVGSYPFALNGLEDLLPAIVYTAHGAQELGHAVADVLFGSYNPAGRLNMTWFRSEDQLPDIMDYDIIKGKRTYQYFAGDPLYPFGHGLSYTHFQYSGLTVEGGKCTAGQPVTVSLRIENTGKEAGDEVVQLYGRVEGSRVPRPIQQLLGFRRVHLQPGEAQMVTFPIQHRDLAFWDVTRARFCVETATYILLAGASSADLRLNTFLDVEGETVPLRCPFTTLSAENYDDYAGLVLEEGPEGVPCIVPQGDAGWAGYFDMDFQSGASRFQVSLRIKSPTAEAEVAIHLDHPAGPKAGFIRLEEHPETLTIHANPSLVLPALAAQGAWHTLSCTLDDVKGSRKVYVVLRGKIQICHIQFAE